ncbi:hypothetical protein GYA19_02230 [Candidatus Beckwithbacteria bacterium]|nr:hypothetical protein [Candidatus Beckwithbacteria bacterium]
MKIFKYLILICCFIFLTSCIKNNATTQNILDGKITIFYGSTCPHCKIVTDYIIENKLMEKLPIQELEVYENKDNQKILQKVATECKLDQNNIGVPLLYENGQCLIGDQPIIDYLKTK